MKAPPLLASLLLHPLQHPSPNAHTAGSPVLIFAQSISCFSLFLQLCDRFLWSHVMLTRLPSASPQYVACTELGGGGFLPTKTCCLPAFLVTRL